MKIQIIASVKEEAGTYSDGKLYTRSKKRGDVNKILDILIMHGATPEIRVELIHI